MLRAVSEALHLPTPAADARETARALATLRQALGEPALEREYGAGQALTLAAAIAAALPGSPRPDPGEPPDSQ